MADVLEATLERGTAGACENATRGWWVMESHHVSWETDVLFLPFALVFPSLQWEFWPCLPSGTLS